MRKPFSSDLCKVEVVDAETMVKKKPHPDLERLTAVGVFPADPFSPTFCSTS